MGFFYFKGRRVWVYQFFSEGAAIMRYAEEDKLWYGLVRDLEADIGGKSGQSRNNISRELEEAEQRYSSYWYDKNRNLAPGEEEGT